MGEQSALGQLHLALGEEDLLAQRAVHAVVKAAMLADPATEVTRVAVPDLTSPGLAELVSPSLFSDGRVIVLESAQDAGKDIAEAITSYIADPAPGIVLVVVHSGGGRSPAGKNLPAALRKAGAEVTECAKITKAPDREAFVRAEVRRASGKIDGHAVTALIDAVGSDLRELASAAGQLVADSGGTVDEQAVRRYHRGRADVTGFTVAEKAVSGDRQAAMESVRWALQLGVPHVLLADALADAVLTIGKVAGEGRANPNQLAPQLGMPPWKVRKAQAQSKGWSQAGLADAMRVAARVNAEVKGAAASADYAVERAVLDIIAARERR